MKKKFVKNYLQIMDGLIGLLIIWSVLFIVCLCEKVGQDVLMIISFSFALPIVMVVIFGAYVVFQTAVIDEKGVTVFFFKKKVSFAAWHDIVSIQKGTLNRSPIYIIKKADGREIHLDRRKKIKAAIDYYMSKQSY